MDNWVWHENSRHNNPVTGFKDFSWGPGMVGLAKVEGTAIHILAMIRTRQDPGVLPVFIDQLSQWHDRIGIWELIMNPRLERMLFELGFERGIEYFGGELARGMVKRIPHSPDCDIYDRPPEGIVKPCNCRI